MRVTETQTRSKTLRGQQKKHRNQTPKRVTFFIDFRPRFLRTIDQKSRKWVPKLIPILRASWDLFLTNFGTILGPKWAPKVSKERPGGATLDLLVFYNVFKRPRSTGGMRPGALITYWLGRLTELYITKINLLCTFKKQTAPHLTRMLVCRGARCGFKRLRWNAADPPK